MHRMPVDSNRIVSVGWENNVMEVEFKDGAVYQYTGVSKDEFESFMSTPSLGGALSQLEKRHPYHRV